MHEVPEGPPPSNRRRFLRRLMAAGGSVAAVSVAGPLVGSAPAGSASSSDERLSALDEYLPDFSSGPPGASIQTSIDRASVAGGGTVVLPVGEYQLTADLVVPSNVTLRGMSWSGTILRPVSDAPVSVVIEDDAEGVSLETLTAPAVRFGAAASHCVVRRVRLLGAVDSAITLPTEKAHHISLEQITIESAGADAIRHTAPDARGVFLSEVAITGFGAGREGTCGIRVAGRAHLSQIHVEIVGPGQVGVAFEQGGEYSTLTNYTMRMAGGTPVTVEPEDLPVARGVGALS